MAEAKEEDPLAEYDGPMIPTRIEWYSSNKRQSVELFGSWNRFKGGDVLEYQGQDTWAVEVKLPLGTYVYRFLVDADSESEDWETNNEIAKNVQDGVEYNVINVREDGAESEEEDDDEDAAEEEEEDDGGDKTLIYDESTGGFVVGKSKKKRRGRPSIEIELPTAFVEEAQKEDKLEEVSEQKAAEDKPKKKKKRRKMKRRGFGRMQQDVDLKALFKQKEEEWARMVFVQQLRQQQQHNDEINRVKTLWKQERQVRVEMHKKIVQQKKKLGQKVISLEGEIDKLKKQNEIGESGQKQISIQLEEQLKKKEEELEKLLQSLKESKDEVTNARKERVEYEKNVRATNADWESEKKKLSGDISRLEQEVKSLTSQNQSLLTNMTTIKEGNQQTRELETQRFATMQSSWEDEKKELLKYKEETKKLKGELSDKETELQKECDEKRAALQSVESEKKKNEELQGKIGDLDARILALSDTSKQNDAVREAVEKERTQLEAEKKVLSDKVETLEKRVAEQKSNFEEELNKVSSQAKADLESLAQKSDKEAAGRIDSLRKDISERDERLRANADQIAKLEDNLTEQKANNDALQAKSDGLTAEVEGLKKERDELTGANSSLTAEVTKLTDDLKTKENEASSADEASKAKIASLEGELASTKEKAGADIQQLEEQSQKLSEQIEQLQKDVNDKAGDAAKLSGELSEANQKIETLTNSEASLNSQVETLNSQLAQEQADAATKLKERDAKIDELNTQMEEAVTKKDEQISDLETQRRTLEDSLNAKLKEFQNAETTIAQLRNEVESNQASFEREKKSLEQQIASAHAKDEKIMKACKLLSQKFQGLRGEMDAIRNQKIQQLEKMNEFFPNFKDLLTKAFGFHQNLIDDLMEKYKRELTLRRKYFNIVQDLRGNIRVFCRVRPLLPFEKKKGYSNCINFPVPGQLTIKDEKGALQKFEFDQVYDSGTSQEQVSEDTTEYVQSVMDGYNVSIFAYGQTGSGKTYTMNGPSDNPGVNLRALKHLFKMAEARAPMFEYKIKVSICEIYNEKIRDLIANVQKGKKKKGDKKKKKDQQDHKIRHLPDGSVEVLGLNWVAVHSDKDIIDLEKEAQKNRTSGVTDMNAHSSRSHMLLIVDVQGFNVPANIQYLGKLYLVDLAGSERVKKSGATGQSLKEAQNINKSLAALGDVMQALQQKQKFIPYRNSTLTDLMTNSLGGNAKTVMFINCCPTAEHAFETISSLKFATRVGKVELGQAKATKKKKKGPKN